MIHISYLNNLIEYKLQYIIIQLYILEVLCIQIFYLVKNYVIHILF